MVHCRRSWLWSWLCRTLALHWLLTMIAGEMMSFKYDAYMIDLHILF